jgi:hypothetical protein
MNFANPLCLVCWSKHRSAFTKTVHLCLLCNFCIQSLESFNWKFEQMLSKVVQMKLGLTASRRDAALPHASARQRAAAWRPCASASGPPRGPCLPRPRPEVVRSPSVPRRKRLGCALRPCVPTPGSRRAARRPMPLMSPCRVPLLFSRFAFGAKAQATYKRPLASSLTRPRAAAPSRGAATPSCAFRSLPLAPKLPSPYSDVHWSSSTYVLPSSTPAFAGYQAAAADAAWLGRAASAAPPQPHLRSWIDRSEPLGLPHLFPGHPRCQLAGIAANPPLVRPKDWIALISFFPGTLLQTRGIYVTNPKLPGAQSKSGFLNSVCF